MESVIIKIIGHLKMKTGFGLKELKLEKPTMLRELVTFEKLRNESLLVVLINEVGGSLDSMVANEDEVKILPVVGGG